MLMADPSNAPAKVGSTIKLLTPNTVVKPADDNGKVYAAFITVTGPVFADAQPITGGFSVVIPKAPEGSAPIAGQSYVVLTGCNTAVTGKSIPSPFKIPLISETLLFI